MARYENVTLPSSGRSVRIPVDENGFVPEEALRQHFHNEGKGVKKGNRNRDVVKDYDDRADIVLPMQVTPRQAAPWWENPWKYDIEALDVQGRPLHNTGGRKGLKKEVHEKISVYSMPGEEAEIRRLLDEALPPEELKKLTDAGEVSVVVRPLHGALGMHHAATGDIDIERMGGKRHNVVLHEGVHALRAKDPERDHIFTKRPDPNEIPYTGRCTNPDKVMELKIRAMQNIEEAGTVAEQLARAKDIELNGYYLQVPVFNEKTRRYRKPTEKEAMKMMEEDRKLFTQGKNKGLAPEDAVKSVEQNFASSHIARLRSSKSRRMAIDDLKAMDASLVAIPVMTDSDIQAEAMVPTSRSKSRLGRLFRR